MFRRLIWGLPLLAGILLQNTKEHICLWRRILDRALMHFGVYITFCFIGSATKPDYYYLLLLLKVGRLSQSWECTLFSDESPLWYIVIGVSVIILGCIVTFASEYTTVTTFNRRCNHENNSILGIKYASLFFLFSKVINRFNGKSKLELYLKQAMVLWRFPEYLLYSIRTSFIPRPSFLH